MFDIIFRSTTVKSVLSRHKRNEVFLTHHDQFTTCELCRMLSICT